MHSAVSTALPPQACPHSFAACWGVRFLVRVPPLQLQPDTSHFPHDAHLQSIASSFAHGERMSAGQALPPCLGCFDTMKRLARYPEPHTQWSVNSASYCPTQS